jgi:hypothetical protein
MTITLDEAEVSHSGKAAYESILEDLVRVHVMDTSLDAGYLAMAADKEREAEAMEWCNAVLADMSDETR